MVVFPMSDGKMWCLVDIEEIYELTDIVERAI